MIRSIELHNFMSHGRTIIEPADGLTVLVGPNNCGKSAAVSALGILCENATGDFMVRHGEKECRVVVRTDDGHVIEWKRLAGTVSYTLDGVEVHRLGGKPPDSLHDLLRLGPVCARDGQQTYDIHFGQQKSPIFLLDEPGSRAATFFASASDADKLMAMQARHRGKVQEAQRDEKRLDQRAQKLAAELKSLTPVGDIELQVAHAEAAHAELLNLTSAMGVLGDAVAALQRQQRAATWLTDRFAVLRNLDTPPRLADTGLLGGLISATENHLAAEALARAAAKVLAKTHHPPTMADTLPLVGLIGQIDETQRQQARNHADAKVTSRLIEPPRLADIQPLTELVGQVEHLSAYTGACGDEVACLRNLVPAPVLADTLVFEQHIQQFQLAESMVATTRKGRDVLASLSQPPEMADEVALGGTIGLLQDVEARHVRMRSRCNLLTALEEPPQPDAVDPLETVIAAFEAAEKAVSDSQSGLTAAQGECAEAEKALRKWAQEYRICPTCGGDIDPERLLSSAASGLGGHNHG